jgi:hypothetical protein
LDVSPDAISLAPGNIDAAVIRAVTTAANLTPVRMVYDTPPAGGVFMIASFDRDGRRTIVTERAQPVANGLFTGDHSTTHVAAGYGAPALVENGVFGLLGDCTPDGFPIVTPLTAVRSFIIRHIPSLSVPPTAARQFTLSERVVNGPLVWAPCDGVNSGEVDVPLMLGKQEAAVDAEAVLLHGQSLRLSEASVLAVGNRSVKLRYTVAGTSVPSYPGPEDCMDAQVLITVHLTLVTSPHASN